VTLQVENWSETGWLKGNCGMFGYYRVNYDLDNWIAISKQLSRNHSVSWNIFTLSWNIFTLSRNIFLNYINYTDI